MQQNKTYKLAGLFIIIGLVCLFGIVFYNAGKKYMTDKKDLVVMYFEESIRGLSVGSPVVLQGVEIGQVSKIKLITDVQTGTFQTPVYVRFDQRKISAYNTHNKTKEEILKRLIKKGLKARLASSNLLTGQLMIELLMDPSQPVHLQPNNNYLQIPTELSPFEQLSKDLGDFSFRESMTRFGNIVITLDSYLPDILNNVTQITTKFDGMLNQKSGEFSKTLLNINATMEEIGKAGRSIKNLTDYLERHPEALIRGKEK